jgi:hypothetical protein
MKSTIRTRRTVVTMVAIAAAGLLAAVPAAASPGQSTGGAGGSGYNAIPSKVSGNVSSYGPEAYAFSEFGDEVDLGGNGRSLQSMSVLLSSWGCQNGTWIGGDCLTTPGSSFEVPLTFTIYQDVNGTPGQVLSRATDTYHIAYRPSASASCTGGRWYNAKDRSCYNGLPQVVSINMTTTTPLPDRVIWSVSYNTTHYGPAPMTESAPCFSEPGGCGYDSLNIGAETLAKSPYAGADVDVDKAFVSGEMQAGYADARPLGAINTK